MNRPKPIAGRRYRASLVCALMGILVPSSAVFLAGCATGKQRIEDFVSCLHVAMPLKQMENVCIPLLQKQAVYVQTQPKLFHEEVQASCREAVVKCEPRNLPQILHLDYSPPATKTQPIVREPYVLVQTPMIGIGGQTIMIFYNQDTGAIVGWVAKGL